MDWVYIDVGEKVCLFLCACLYMLVHVCIHIHTIYTHVHTYIQTYTQGYKISTAKHKMGGGASQKQQQGTNVLPVSTVE